MLWRPTTVVSWDNAVIDALVSWENEIIDAPAYIAICYNLSN